MITQKKVLNAFSELGSCLRKLENPETNSDNYKIIFLEKLIQQAYLKNRWFIPQFSRAALINAGHMLTNQQLITWIDSIKHLVDPEKKKKTVAVINAGNVPAVGFADFVNVVCSGHTYLGKLSSDDPVLLPGIGELLLQIEPELKGSFRFTQDKLVDFEAVIATGSDNTSRYFEYYFGKYPNIIRKNRNGIAVLTGKETDDQLSLLAKDVFMYFGLGCRSVSKIFVPLNFDFSNMIEAFQNFSWIDENHKYKNNYDYYKAIFMVNGDSFFDTGFLLLKEEGSYASPLSVLYFEKYNDLDKLKKRLDADVSSIQCKIGSTEISDDFIPWGQSQVPELTDYADGVNTMEFLLSL
ncbi:MAG: hypothetical protein KDC05_14475 [Bacteroidales bacterium]|nr:hypothetical protein [Bacteroidales bacterium]